MASGSGCDGTKIPTNFVGPCFGFFSAFVEDSFDTLRAVKVLEAAGLQSQGISCVRGLRGLVNYHLKRGRMNSERTCELDIGFDPHFLEGLNILKDIGFQECDVSVNCGIAHN